MEPKQQKNYRRLDTLEFVRGDIYSNTDTLFELERIKDEKQAELLEKIIKNCATYMEQNLFSKEKSNSKNQVSMDVSSLLNISELCLLMKKKAEEAEVVLNNTTEEVEKLVKAEYDIKMKEEVQKYAKEQRNEYDKKIEKTRNKLTEELEEMYIQLEDVKKKNKEQKKKISVLAKRTKGNLTLSEGKNEIKRLKTLTRKQKKEIDKLKKYEKKLNELQPKLEDKIKTDKQTVMQLDKLKDILSLSYEEYNQLKIRFDEEKELNDKLRKVNVINSKEIKEMTSILANKDKELRNLKRELRDVYHSAGY